VYPAVFLPLLIGEANGTRYPIKQIMTSLPSLNETAYNELGPLYVSAQLRWGMFFDFASYTSAMVWMAMFGYPALKDAWKKHWERRKTGCNKTANEQYTDQLNVLMRSYKEVPLHWYLVLMAISFIIIFTTISTSNLYMPWWTAFVAVATGAVVVVVSLRPVSNECWLTCTQPLGWLYAVSNFQLVSFTRGLYAKIFTNEETAYRDNK
jgi:hypothetical protein